MRNAAAGVWPAEVSTPRTGPARATPAHGKSARPRSPLSRPARTRPGRIQTWQTLLAALPLALALPGCVPEESAAARTTVRDSAGIRIVQNGPPAWSEGEAWMVAPDPLVEIGVLQGPPEYQLFDAYSAVRLSDGSIVVANAGTEELRFYDPRGRHLITVGGEGGGPGEFEGLRWVAALAGDTVIAWDWNSRRISLFGPDGRFLRSVLVAGLSGYGSMFHGAFADRSFLLDGGFMPDFEEGTHVSRPEVAYLRFDLDGLLRDTVGRHAGTQRITVMGGSGGNSWISLRDLAFPRDTHVAVQGDRVYAADSERYEIAVYTSTGVLTTLIRKPHRPIEVTSEDVDWFEEDFLAPLEGAEPDDARRRMLEQVLAEMPFPETFPAFADLRVDAANNVWVEASRPPSDEEEPSSWTIFDADGHLLGSIQTPPGLEVLQIGDDFVLGRWQDELDVDRIRLYELIKPEASVTAAGASTGMAAVPAPPVIPAEPPRPAPNRNRAAS